jgi:hypothetical protein
MAFRKVRLELARTAEFPEGSNRRGYEFTAPLNDEGHLDVEEWKRHKNRCSVRRFWEGEDDEQGILIRTRHNTWAFSYAAGEDDDEPMYRIDAHTFRVGDYVSITEHDGVTRPFKVVLVR